MELRTPMLTKTLVTVLATVASFDALAAASITPLTGNVASFVSEDGRIVICRDSVTSATLRWQNGVITSAGENTLPIGISHDGKMVVGWKHRGGGQPVCRRI